MVGGTNEVGSLYQEKVQQKAEMESDVRLKFTSESENTAIIRKDYTFP